MLLRRLKEIEKNHIIFTHKGNLYYDSLNNDNRLNIFNIPLMNIYLEQFTDEIGLVSYNDIISISLIENHDLVIENLPQKLIKLKIASSMCERLVLGECVLSIEEIGIDNSNINEFPDISKCQKLRMLRINHSGLSKLVLNYNLPDTLSVLDLQWNLITNNVYDEFCYNQLIDRLESATSQNNKLYINLSDNYLDLTSFPPELESKCNLLRQHQYQYNPIDLNNSGRAYIHERLISLSATTRQNKRRNQGNVTSIVNPAQIVHMTSINKNILESLCVMKRYILQKNIQVTELPDNANVTLFVCFGNKAYNEDLESFSFHCKNQSRLFRNTLTTNFSIPTVTHKEYTYKKVFEMIWSIVCYDERHFKKPLKNAMKRIVTEVLDGTNLCFTGHFNRLVNSMVGLVDGVKVGFSEGEELQLEFGKILDKLNSTNNDYAFENAVTDASEVLEFAAETTRQNWMDALYDLNRSNIESPLHSSLLEEE